MRLLTAELRILVRASLPKQKKRRRSRNDAGEKDETVFIFFIGISTRKSPVFFAK